ncbi:MAG: TRAM domain-containing protein, partial [Desulfobacterales bacterium]|nr:TRAM domain-containing protein [Desulfobacterales bacterium]
DANSENIQWTGRTSTNKIVNFIPNNNFSFRDGNFSGRIINVRIEKALSHSLQGIPVETFAKRPLLPNFGVRLKF